MWKIALEWYYQHISVVWLIALLLFTAPLFLMFRHSPAIPDLRFSECFVAMIYITDMLLIYSTVSSVLCFDDMADMVYGILLLFLFIVPVRQLSGYSYWSTIWRLLVALIPFCIIVILIIVAVFAIWGVHLCQLLVAFMLISTARDIVPGWSIGHPFSLPSACGCASRGSWECL